MRVNARPRTAALQRSNLKHRQLQRRHVACCATATFSETRKLLAARGWGRAWIDGVTERIQRKQVTASIEEMEAVVCAHCTAHMHESHACCDEVEDQLLKTWPRGAISHASSLNLRLPLAFTCRKFCRASSTRLFCKLCDAFVWHHSCHDAASCRLTL